MRDVPANGTTVSATLKHLLSRISAVVFSCPACITPNLADAMLEDRLLINTIHDRDVIPRFSFKTLEVLAGELKDPAFVAKADHWYQSDKTDFGQYAQSLGKAGDIVKANRGADKMHSDDSPQSLTEDHGKVQDAPLKPPRVGKGGMPISSTGTGAIAGTTIDKDKLTADDSARETTDSTSIGSSSVHASSSTLSSTIDLAKGWLSNYRARKVADIDNTSVNHASAASDVTTTTDSSHDQTVPEQPAVPRIETVTPAPIVHLFTELDGTAGAAVVTFRHESFRKMTIIPAHIAEDHFIPRTREALRSVLLRRGKTDDRVHEKEAVAIDKYFDIPDTKSIDRTYESIGQTSSSNGFTLQPISSRGAAIDREGTERWEPCYVCGVDVTWPYVLHSDASRAMVRP